MPASARDGRAGGERPRLASGAPRPRPPAHHRSATSSPTTSSTSSSTGSTSTWSRCAASRRSRAACSPRRPGSTGAVGGHPGRLDLRPDRAPARDRPAAAGVVIIPGLLLAGGFILAAGAAPGPYAAVVFLACCLGCQQFTDSAYWAAATSVGGRHAATACGLLNTGGNVVGGRGGAAGPDHGRAGRLAGRPRHRLPLCPRRGAALARDPGRPDGRAPP